MKRIFTLLLIVAAFALLFSNKTNAQPCPGGLLQNPSFSLAGANWGSYGSAAPVYLPGGSGCLNNFVTFPTTFNGNSGIQQQIIIPKDSCYQLCFCSEFPPATGMNSSLYIAFTNGTVSPAQLIAGTYTSLQAQLVYSSLNNTGPVPPMTSCINFQAAANYNTMVILTNTVGLFGTDVRIDNVCLTKTTCPTVSTCNSVNAAFTYTVGPGNTVNFTNTSTTNTSGATFTWNYGNSSSAVNPGFPTHSYTYANPGTYLVCLYVDEVQLDGTLCQDTICIDVIVPPSGCSGTSANFTYTIGPGNTVNFTNTSTTSSSTPTFTWGYGNTASAVNPGYPNHSYTYASPGTYTVCLYLFDQTVGAFCRDTICKTITIPTTGCNGVNAAFTYTVGPGFNVNFTNTSTSNTTGATYTWDYGNSSSAINPGFPTHTYNYGAAGTYIVCLYLSEVQLDGTICKDTLCLDVIVPPTGCSSVAANFSFTVGTGNTVTFTNTSTTNTTGATFTWDYGDANTATNPGFPTHSYTYANPGTYIVCLYISEPLTNGLVCTDTICFDVVIQGNCTSTNANFTFTYGPNYQVIFTNTSTTGGGSVTYNWDYGNAFTSTNPGFPTHSYTYAGQGVYTVCLYVTEVLTNGTVCRDTICKTVTPVPVSILELAAPVVNIYPNPAQNKITIDVPPTSTLQSLTFVNYTGQAVYTVNPKTTTVELPASLANGLYTLVVNGKGWQTQHRLSIAR